MPQNLLQSEGTNPTDEVDASRGRPQSTLASSLGTDPSSAETSMLLRSF